MITLDPTEQEREILSGVLESTLGDLRMEISHTDSKDVRDLLKKRKQVLKKVVDALKESGEAESAA